MARTVLVTGASRGIGRAIALRLARDGFALVLHYHQRADAAHAVLAELRQQGGEARLLAFDTGDRAGARAALEADLAAHEAYYGVVCNAGICRDAPFPALTGEDWDLVLRTNLDGFYNVLAPLVMPMVQARAGGRIVTISSASGIVGQRGQVNYSAAKAGLIGATKALAQELAKRKITVNCVAPGLIDTDMIAAVDPAAVLEAIPLRRYGTPDEVAALVAFLFRDEAAYITRQVISINGGLF